LQYGGKEEGVVAQLNQSISSCNSWPKNMKFTKNNLLIKNYPLNH